MISISCISKSHMHSNWTLNKNSNFRSVSQKAFSGILQLKVFLKKELIIFINLNRYYLNKRKKNYHNHKDFSLKISMNESSQSRNRMHSSILFNRPQMPSNSLARFKRNYQFSSSLIFSIHTKILISIFGSIHNLNK